MWVLGLALFLLLTFLDAEFTIHRLYDHGIEVELNPAIRWLCKYTKIEVGVYTGILVPTGGLVALGWFYPHILSYMLGVRTTLFLFQMKSRA